MTYHIGYPSSILDPRDPNHPIVQAALLATYYEELCSGCQSNKDDAPRTGSTDVEQSESNRTSDHYAGRTGREETNENQFMESLNASRNATGSTMNRTSSASFDKDDYLAKGEILKNSNSTFNVSEIFDKDEPDNRNSSSSYLFYSTWQLFKYFLAKSASPSSLYSPNLTAQQLNQTNKRPTLETELACNSTVGCGSVANFSGTTLANVEDSTGGLADGDNKGNPIGLATFSVENGTRIAPNVSSAPQAVASSTKITLSAAPGGSSDIGTALAPDSSGELTAKATNKCPGLEIDCSEFSIDKMLAVRLCCLNGNSLLSKGNGVSCRRFDRTECSKVLPIIKCCLRDLSEILEDYFNKKNVKNER